MVYKPMANRTWPWRPSGNVAGAPRFPVGLILIASSASGRSKGSVTFGNKIIRSLISIAAVFQ
jgi:hypothetical protein